MRTEPRVMSLMRSFLARRRAIRRAANLAPIRAGIQARRLPADIAVIHPRLTLTRSI